MAIRSSSISQFEGMMAGFDSQLLCIKKRICCSPTVEQQEDVADAAVQALEEPYALLESVAERLEES